MAASGSTTIQLYNSSTASAVPTSGNLVQGELGINVTDKKIYTKNASAAVVVVGFGPDASVALTALTGLTVASGGASITGNSTVTGTLGATGAFSLGSSSLSDIGDFHGQGGVGAYVKFIDDANSATRGFVGYGSTLFGANLSDFGIRSQGNLLLSSYGTVAATFDNNQNLGLGVTPKTSTGSYKAFEIGAAGNLSSVSSGIGTSLSSNTYVASGAIQTYAVNGAAATYELGAGTHAWYTAPSGTAGNPISFTQAMTLDPSGNLLVGTSTTSSFHRLVKNNPGDWAASIRNTSGSNPYGLTVNFEGVTGGAGQFFISCQDDTARFRVLGNGNVQNINNSYGSISSKAYKTNIVDTTPKLAKLLKYRVVNYSLKDDPDQLKQIGLIWEELYEISPGLCEETPEFADVEIEPARTEIKVTQRQKTRTEESTRYEVLLVDGQWTKLPVRTEVQVPLFDLHPLFEQDGSPVMEVAEPAIEASPALYDKDGNEVTPAVEAKPAVMRQVMLQVPVMEDVEETVEIPAKTESRPTGNTIKSVKYSVLVPMLVKAMQEQQAQIEELKAKVGA